MGLLKRQICYVADEISTSGKYTNICLHLLSIFNINYFLQLKLRYCHVCICVQQDEGNATVIAETLEGKENEDSHEDTEQLLQDMRKINTEASHSDEDTSPHRTQSNLLRK